MQCTSRKTERWRQLVLGSFVAMTLTASAQTLASSDADSLRQRSYERRAVEAAIWGIPLVNFDAMRQAYFRDSGAHYNDVLYWSKPSDWRNQTTTPNHSTPYVMFFYNLKDGPVVVDVPPARDNALYGSLLNAWNQPLINVGSKGQDQGNGGRYLLTPPGYQGEIPAGYIPVPSATFNGYSLLRVITANLDADELAKGAAYVRQLKVHPLNKADDAQPSRFIDMAGKTFEGIPRYDARFYESLARMVAEEPIQERDLAVMGQLRTLGIGKGQTFSVGDAQRGLLDRAAVEARDYLAEGFAATGVPLWGEQRHWRSILDPQVVKSTQLSFVEPGQSVRVDDRGYLFYAAFAPPVPSTPQVLYVKAHVDGTGAPLDGAASYRLRVPAKVPASQFWAVDVYDTQTAGFIRESQVVGLDSYDHRLTRNADGSVDLYFSPQAPAGHERNWIGTQPGKGYFVLFRVYGPQPAILDRSWVLDDLLRLP